MRSGRDVGAGLTAQHLIGPTAANAVVAAASRGASGAARAAVGGVAVRAARAVGALHRTRRTGVSAAVARTNLTARASRAAASAVHGIGRDALAIAGDEPRRAGARSVLTGRAGAAGFATRSAILIVGLNVDASAVAFVLIATALRGHRRRAFGTASDQDQRREKSRGQRRQGRLAFVHDRLLRGTSQAKERERERRLCPSGGTGGPSPRIPQFTTWSTPRNVRGHCKDWRSAISQPS